MKINDANLLQQVVNYLEKHQEAERIKKMLYCLCTNRWEKDIDYLNSINSQYLIEQIVNDRETLESLRTLLQKLIETVNKPKQYIQIAKVVYLAIGQLYPEFQQEHRGKPSTQPPPAQIPTPTPIIAPTQANDAYIAQHNAPIANSDSNPGIPSAIQRAYMPAPTQTYTSQDIPSSFQRAYDPLPTQQFESQAPTNDDVDESAYETYYDAQMPEEIAPEGEAQRSIPEYDPFVLRQNVMSYTNPLRAKIILLVMLRPNINFSNQSAASIREYFLDDLLLELVQTYPTIRELEESITYAVEQLVEVEEYGKAATGLLQSLAHLYALATPNGR